MTKNKNIEVFVMPTILTKGDIYRIEDAVKNGVRVFDYKNCLFMSLDVFVELNELFQTIDGVKELNTTEIKKITRDYYYGDEYE